MTHPKLRTALDAPDVCALIAISLRARAAQDEGRYCECADPELVGTDLMCGACLLNNRQQEISAVRRLVTAHDHVPGEGDEFRQHFCTVCAMPPDAPRHNGVHAVGRTSWGMEVRP